MDETRPSLAKRAAAVLVLVVAAVVALRFVLGAITAVAWLVALLAVVIAAFWAVSTLKSAKRTRSEKRARGDKRAAGVQPASAGRLPAAPAQDRVDAQLRQIKEQLREQGRL